MNEERLRLRGLSKAQPVFQLIRRPGLLTIPALENGPSVARFRAMALHSGSSLLNNAVAGLLAGAGIFVMVMLALAAETPIAAVPFATSIVLVAGAPHSAPASTWSILAGHLISAITGLIVLKLGFTGAAGMAAAVALSVGLMLALDAFHPPAGITPLVIHTMAPGWTFLVVPVLAGAAGVAILARLSGWLRSRME